MYMIFAEILQYMYHLCKFFNQRVEFIYLPLSTPSSLCLSPRTKTTFIFHLFIRHPARNWLIRNLILIELLSILDFLSIFHKDELCHRKNYSFKFQWTTWFPGFRARSQAEKKRLALVLAQVLKFSIFVFCKRKPIYGYFWNL